MKAIKLTLLPIKPLHLSYAHLKTLQGLAYSLMGIDESLATEIHDRSYPDKKAFKFFCYTDICGRYRNDKKNQKLIYNGSITWELRSADNRIIDAAEHYVSKHKTVEISGQMCVIISYEMIEKHFCCDSLSISMNTPISVYSRTKDSGFRPYHHPYEQAFYDAVIKNIKNKFEMFYEKQLPCNVIFICKRLLDKDKCVTHIFSDKEDSVVTAWYGDYEITATPEVLDFIWHTGLGSSNSIGFGTIIEK